MRAENVLFCVVPSVMHKKFGEKTQKEKEGERGRNGPQSIKKLY
jgi:hypothetical protein